MRLAPYHPDYLAPYIAWRLEAATRRHNPLRPMTNEQIASMLAEEGHDLSLLSEFAKFRWFVLLGARPVGSVCLKEISLQMGHAEIGYGFGAEWHGQGLGTAAVRQVVGRILAETPLRKLTAFVHPDNVASYRLLERLGFQREGMLREHYVIDGVPVDELLYGLLRREWQM